MITAVPCSRRVLGNGRTVETGDRHSTIGDLSLVINRLAMTSVYHFPETIDEDSDVYVDKRIRGRPSETTSARDIRVSDVIHSRSGCAASAEGKERVTSCRWYQTDVARNAQPVKLYVWH